jgi:deoxyhypusine synthase
MNHRLGIDLRPPRFQYAVRICPEPTHWGGLSGCTYSEGVSWGKFVPETEGGRFAEVYADATTVWPLLIKGVLEEMEKRGRPHPHTGVVPGRGPRKPRKRIAAKPRP